VRPAVLIEKRPGAVAHGVVATAAALARLLATAALGLALGGPQDGRDRRDRSRQDRLDRVDAVRCHGG
jgi:hypothetical protein